MNTRMFFPRVAWWLMRLARGTRYNQLFQEIEKSKPTYIMEIGTWNGDNAVKMISAAKRHHPANQIHYFGFDLFEDMTDSQYFQEISKRPPTLDSVQQKLVATGANVKLYKGDTNCVLSKTLPVLPTMEFVFIDGGHDVSTIHNDWTAISKHLSPKTVVIFDDYWGNRNEAGCKPVIESINKADFEVLILPVKDKYCNADFGRLNIQLAKVIKKQQPSQTVAPQ